MKTTIVTTCWLDLPDYLGRTIKWIKYYKGLDLNVDLILLDNNSKKENKDILYKNCDPGSFKMVEFNEHFSRTAHYEYAYLWRAVHHFSELFKTYDKIVYMDNDFYILSDNMLKDVWNMKGWVSPYCDKHKFPETGLQVVTKDCQEYKDFANMSQEDFIKKNNGKCMETALPLTQIIKTFNGDRWSEYGKTIQEESWDYSAQTSLSIYTVFGLKK